MKLKLKLGRWAAGMAAIAAAAGLPGAARACELVPEDQMPSAEEQLRHRFESPTVIALAVATKRGRSKVPFKVLHVYKGSLRAGARLTLRPRIEGCPTGEKPWPTEKGEKGVIGVYDQSSSGDRDEFLFLRPGELEKMFQKGWIRRAGG
jgi:hypothetical protein